MTVAAADPFEAGFGTILPSVSLEQHASHARGWAIEYRQLGRGRFAGTLAYSLAADAQYALNHSTPGLMSTGLAPPGTVILCAQVEAEGETRFFGERFEDGQVGVLHPDRAFDLRVWGRGTTFTATLQPARVDAYLHVVLGCPLEDLEVGQALRGALGPGERARRLERIGLHAVLGRPGALADAQVARQFEEQVLHAMCAGVVLPRQRSRRTRSYALARRADEFLRAHLDRPVTVADLCRETGASERTLHHAFQLHFNSSPMAHLKLLRLNAAHCELMRGDAAATVTSVAMRWGFFHPGWFSHDYRRMFACSPTETLRSARDGRQFSDSARAGHGLS